MAIDKQTVYLIAGKVRALAHQKKEGAAYGGSWGDGGAAHDEELLSYWLLGIEGKMPVEYAAIVTAAKREQDADYKEYLRLKQKFEQ